jgi:hypothetical protein
MHVVTDKVHQVAKQAWSALSVDLELVLWLVALHCSENHPRSLLWILDLEERVVVGSVSLASLTEIEIFTH